MSCVKTLDHVTRKCGTKVAVGLDSFIYIAHKDEVTAIAAPTSGTLNVATMTFAATKGFFKIEIATTLSKNTFNVTPPEDKDITNHKTTFSLFHAGVDSATSYILGGLAGQDFIALIPDRDGNLRICGNTKTGCTIKAMEDINGDTNGYTITGDWDSAHPPYFFTGTPTVEGAS